MKNAQKLSLKFAIALLLLIGIVGCEDIFNKEQEVIITTKDVQDIIIPTSQAQELYDTYSKRRVELIRDFENALDSVNQQMQSKDDDPKSQFRKNQLKKAAAQRGTSLNTDKGFQPTEYIRYDYKSLKKYMKFIEQQTADAGYEISTMRIYLANYPEKDYNKDKNRRNTVMFVPTINVDSSESAYYLSDEILPGKPRPYLIDSLFNDTKKPAPVGKLSDQNSNEKASLLSDLLIVKSPIFLANRQEVIGNEGHLHP